jgi:hypothetical protein
MNDPVLVAALFRYQLPTPLSAKSRRNAELGKAIIKKRANSFTPR